MVTEPNAMTFKKILLNQIQFCKSQNQKVKANTVESEVNQKMLDTKNSQK